MPTHLSEIEVAALIEARRALQRAYSYTPILNRLGPDLARAMSRLETVFPWLTGDIEVDVEDARAV